MLGALLLFLVFGFVALLLGFSRWLANRPWAAAGNLLVAFALFWITHAYWPVVLHLRTYEPLRGGAIAAQVYCERTAPGAFRLTLTRLPGGRMQVYEMTGDEWRIDARTIVWKGPASRLGLPPSFRFERLTSRFLHSGGTAKVERTGADVAQPAGYALDDGAGPGEDVWAQARTGERWRGRVEPGRTYGPWRPMADGARYDVWVDHADGDSNARIDARPANEAAAKSLM